jgi:divalent metal cation (Fe/Co/Zn/Cd) transporter
MARIAETQSARETLIQRALRLEVLTLGWMTIEAAVAIGSGIIAHSLTLMAFGADSVIELLSAAVLLWRLRVELRQGERFPETIEHRAARLAAGLLFALAAYVIASAAWGLTRGERQEFSAAGLTVAIIAIPAMYVLATRKKRIADEIGSRALHADAVESLSCGYLSVVVVAGLLAQVALGAWWVDSVSALALVPFLVKEGREAWQGEECCDHD